MDNNIDIFFDTIRTSKFLSIIFAPYELTEEKIKKQVVLDYGCGYGGGSYYLAKHAKTVTGYDLDITRIEFAEKTFVSSCVNLVYTNQYKDLIAHYYDVICIFHVFTKKMNIADIVKQVLMLIKPTGRIYIALKDEFVGQLICFETLLFKLSKYKYRVNQHEINFLYGRKIIYEEIEFLSMK
ncbi:methyltransferase domain-containing protein [Paratissierella segnis]|jgi:2-polyprenyl-3-methyl-5-hydroxy-6-metoxy-1,4-benzoquinol methylase|uniref:Methyltransferase domain-containing protein n=1 Tax=Paratissierella segnis TaxID=2763679 RepID=A0A926IFW9_9FIRM|nr:methyltransferase domain-containing protein [Paratissierella segnis]MBC8588957.1 methyltransferase domain-containing protein [Paratissierella segnis]